jgi:hypothetical protein
VIKFSIFLILIALVLLGATLSPQLSPNNPTILSAMERLLCAPGENLTQQAASSARNQGTGSTSFVADMNLSCKPANGNLYSVSDKLLGIGLTGFLVFLVFGLLFLIIGIIRNASRGKAVAVVTTSQTTPYYPPQRPVAAPPRAAAYPPTPAPTQQPYTSYSPSTGYSTATVVNTPPSTPSDKFDFDAAATMMSIPKPTATPPPAPAASDTTTSDSALKGRLQQLRDAFEAGLISSEEYERSKSDLLRDFTDVN